MRTPRDAKRLFNVYRMIRATRNLSSASPQAFLGGLAARPAGPLGWGEFATDLAPVEPPPGSELPWRNNVIGEIAEPSVPAWQRMHLAVSATSGLVTLTGLAAFQSWAPAVRRFSYALLTGETDA